MATRSRGGAEALLIYGPPQRLTMSSSPFADGDRLELVLPPELRAYADDRVISLRVPRRRTGVGRLRISLRQGAPPGRYDAELRLDTTTYAVSIEVTSVPRLRVFPLSVDFAGKPGATAEAEIIVANEGNVPIAVPERTLVGVYDDEGVEMAFADTYRQETDEPGQLLGHWLRKLREGYGGLLKLQIAEGAGTLAPGVEQKVRIKTKLSEQLNSGHSYHGIWALGPVNYRLALTIHK